MKKIFHDILGLDNRIKISQLNISIFFPVTAKLKKKSKKNPCKSFVFIYI